MAYPTTARLWPYRPNWDDSVNVQTAYKTDIFTARSGREQRRALRSKPRRQVSYAIAVDGSQRQQFVRDIQAWQGRPMLLPDPVRRCRTSEFAAAGASVIKLPVIPAWIYIGRQLLIGGETVCAVTAIDQDRAAITVDVDFASPLVTGTLVQPLLRGILAGSLTAAHPVSRVATAKINFSVEPGTEQEDAGSPGVYILEGREVFTKRPNWIDGIDQSFEWPVEQVDYGHGRVATYQPVTMGWLTQSATFLNVGAEDQAEIETFFHRMRGCRGEFLMPTWTEDLGVTGVAVEGQSVLTMSGIEDGDTGSIMIRLRGGRLLMRRIVAAVGGAITVNRPWSEGFTPSDVAGVSRLEVARFASDALTFEWPTNHVAQVKIGIKTLENLPAEAPLADLDDLAQFLLESSWGQLLGPLADFSWMLNARYAAVYWYAVPWTTSHENELNSFDYFVNFTAPEKMG